MKMKHWLLGILMLFVIKSFAQKTESEPQKPYIEVVGTAEMEIIPNEIFIGIFLKERIVNKEKISIETQEEQLKTNLKNAGIDLKNLTLANSGVAFAQIRDKEEDTLVTKHFQLIVNTLNDLNKSFIVFVKLNIEFADVVKVSHTEMDKFRKEVRIKAIQAARDKAKYLLEAIGEKLGKPLKIDELQLTDYMDSMDKNKDMFSIRSKQEYISRDFLSFTPIKLNSTMFAKFEILP